MATSLYRTLTGQSQRSDHSATSTQKIAPTPTNTSSTTDPLTGTLNHLTLKQEAALEDFKERLEKQGWWVRDVNNGKPSHDDGTLLYEAAVLISEDHMLIGADDICGRGSSTSMAPSASSQIPRSG
jgi:hypothetical protein